MVGEIKLWSPIFGPIPEGWHICDGSYVGNRRLPKMGSITVTAHLEPEGDGTHEKVIAQTKTDGLVAPKDVVYIICLADIPLSTTQINAVQEIAREVAEDVWESHQGEE